MMIVQALIGVSLVLVSVVPVLFVFLVVFCFFYLLYRVEKTNTTINYWRLIGKSILISVGILIVAFLLLAVILSYYSPGVPIN